MRIGVLTHSAGDDNYGQILQCYALQQYLKKSGHQPFLILPIATIKSQTVTYYGLTREEIVKFVNEDHPQGVDRFVPLGKSMDFTLVWDGYDLITTLSRIVNIV